MAEIRLLELRSASKRGGGPEKTILLSAERHDRSRVSVVAAYLRPRREQEFWIGRTARARGVTFYEIEDRGKFDPRILRAIQEIVVAHDINVVHAHDYKTDLFVFLLRWWLRKRAIAVLSTAHGWGELGLRRELYRRLDLFLMRYFHHLIAVSHATKAEMVASGVPAEAISVIHNGIDTTGWSPLRDGAGFREELGLGCAFPVIGYVGRISPEKDLETWLRTVAIVGKKYPEARFVLVGEGRNGSTQHQLERLASELGIRARVSFPGYRDHLQPVYAAFDVFLLTSLHEGLPNGILEAMAMSRPVVTTDVAGAVELVVDGATGFVFPQGDVRGLADGLLVLAGDEQLRLRMGQAGRKRVESEFDFASRLRRVEDLYESVLSLRSCPGVS